MCYMFLVKFRGKSFKFILKIILSFFFPKIKIEEGFLKYQGGHGPLGPLGALFFQLNMQELQGSFMCSLSHINFLINYVSCLDNILGQSYNLSCNKLKKLTPSRFRAKLYPSKSILFQRKQGLAPDNKLHILCLN